MSVMSVMWGFGEILAVPTHTHTVTCADKPICRFNVTHEINSFQMFLLLRLGLETLYTIRTFN